MNLEPLLDRVIIKVDEPKEEKTKSGIIMATTSQTEPKDLMTGTVVASGPGTYRNSVFVHNVLKVGDRVMYRRPLTDKLTMAEDDAKYVMTNESDVVAKIKT
jgi:Co-chaperonin GroES (HSP10)